MAPRKAANNIEEENLITVTPKKLATMLKECFDANVVPIVWSKPGIGKSSIARQVASAYGDYLDVRVNLRESVDFSGFPYLVDLADGTKMMRTARPEFVPFDGAGVIHYEEPNRAVTMVMNSLLQVVLERQSGLHKLGAGWKQMMSCNYEADGGGVNKMPDALYNRCEHIHLVTNFPEWKEWAVLNDIHEFVIAYLINFPDDLHRFEKGDKAFPSPRTWEKVSDIIKKLPKPRTALEKQNSCMREHICGLIGPVTGNKFATYMNMAHDLPDVSVILMNPDGAMVPHDPSALYAVACALSKHADQGNFDSIKRYLDRLEPEYSVFAIRDAAVRDKKIVATQSFRKWSAVHHEFVSA